MANIRCPNCGESIPSKSSVCKFCGKVLEQGSNHEKENPFNAGPLKPGNAPLKKDPEEQDGALPDGLRSEGDDEPSSSEHASELTAGRGSLPASKPGSASEDSSAPPDWLAGLDKVASEQEEQIPDWLAGFRRGRQSPTAQAARTVEIPSKPDGSDHLMSPGEVSRVGQSEKNINKHLPLGSETSPEEIPGSAFPDALPEWLQSSPYSEADAPVSSNTPESAEGLPEWLSGLQGISGEGLSSAAASGEPASIDASPDWLDRLKEDEGKPQPVPPGELFSPALDWLSSLESKPGEPTSSAGESVPPLQSTSESKSVSGESQALTNSDALSQEMSKGVIPDWLSSMQADVNAMPEPGKPEGDSTGGPEKPSPADEVESTPGWLNGIEETITPSTGTPALILEDNDELSKGAAFAMEMPEWLSRLKPDQSAEKSRGNVDEQSAPEELSASDLPSWVQAMRPVESVISETTGGSSEAVQAAEQKGPLAGLSGVLPFEPGLGPLRKPPAYSVKLQLSEGQQRYAAFLERMVSGETHPHVVETVDLRSNRLWRWLITALLFLALGLPLVTRAQVTPGASILSSDNSSAKILSDGIPPNAPVLIAFEYEPAFSGEMEAAAAPVIDQLLMKECRLTIISTSQTGPALAERFLRTSPLVNTYHYRSEDQYVNLGYLPGGSAGILYFATDPQQALPRTANGISAWNLVPLEGVQAISSYTAVIVITNDGDTGRSWIEQAGPYLGETPMLMIASAQAAPLFQPYFESGQIKGLVSGLEDAKIYEQDYNRPGLANNYWTSFSFGLLVAEGLIGIGAILAVIENIRARRVRSGGKT